MNSTPEKQASASASATTLWIVLLAALSVAGSLAFACAAPFAATAALAAHTMRRMEGVVLVIVTWLANQVVGFGLLGYPLEASTFGWGAAIGAAAVIGYFAARGIERIGMPAIAALAASLVAAFFGYELALYGYGLAVGDSGEAFSTDIVGRVFLINAGAFVGLVALHRAAVALALLRPAPETTPVTA